MGAVYMTRANGMSMLFQFVTKLATKIVMI